MILNKTLNKINLNLEAIINFYLKPPFPKKILFDHIPKCAGSSIITMLKKNYPLWKRYLLREPYEKSVEKFKQLPYKKRNSFYLIAGHLAGYLIEYINKEEFICCTVLRDPVSRIISHYFYVKNTPNHYLYKYVSNADFNLKKYVALDIKITKELKNWYVQYFSRLSYDQIMKNPDKAIKLAISNIEKNYDIIGFQEDLKTFIKKLQKLSDIKVRKIEKINVSKKTKISYEEIEEIKKHNELDIILYNEIKQKWYKNKKQYERAC